MLFNTRVNNIPCQCRVILAKEDKNKVNEFIFVILDRKGYRAPWLERYVDKHTKSRLINEYTQL